MSREPGPPGSPGGGSERDRKEREPADAEILREMLERAGRIGGHVSRSMAARRDLAKVSLRRTIFVALAGLLVLVVSAGILITAGSFLLTGLSGALVAVFDLSPWLAKILVGGATLVIFATGALVAVAVYRRRALDRVVERYGAEAPEESADRTSSE